MRASKDEHSFGVTPDAQIAIELAKLERTAHRRA